MRRSSWVLGGLALGAGVLMVLDASRGRPRLATLRDRMRGRARRVGGRVGARAVDLKQRARGVVAHAGAKLHRDTAPLDDARLEARIRSKIGRVVSHAHAIEVAVDAGRVTLRGPILSDEVEALRACVSGVPGVRAVDSQLESHPGASNIPALQGGVLQRLPRQPGGGRERARWETVAGGGLVLTGILRGGMVGVALAGAGVLLGLREVRRGRVIRVQKTVTLRVPVEEVYAAWRELENFPRFMSHVRSVEDLGGDRSRWTVLGPAGIPVTWEAVITRDEPERLLSWRSVRGSTVENQGSIRFEEVAGGATRVQLRLDYRPPGGTLAHAVARLFHTDPEHTIDEDLARMKAWFEADDLAPATGEPESPPAAPSSAGGQADAEPLPR